MTTTSRILIGTIVAFVVIAAGFAAGLRFHEKRNLTKAADPVAITDTAEKDSSVPNTTIYEISPPSLGLMLETYAINIVSDSPIAQVEIPSDHAKKIEAGQKVFLYDKNGELINSIGTITGVKPSGNITMVEIDLRNNPDISTREVTRGKIIIDRNPNAFRLPYSALSRNEKGDTFAWEVTDDISGDYKVKYKPIEILSTSDTVFSVQTDHQSTNLFILNPDANLRDGQKVNVRKFLYKPPSQHEEARIASIVERRMRQIESDKQLAANPPPGAAGSTSCAQSCGSSPQNFIDKIKSISKEQKPSPTSP